MAIKLTLATTIITLLILSFLTYRITAPCHPDCTPRLIRPAMDVLDPDAGDRTRHDRRSPGWESPLEQDRNHHPWFPTSTPRPSAAE